MLHGVTVQHINVHILQGVRVCGSGHYTRCDVTTQAFGGPVGLLPLVDTQAPLLACSQTWEMFLWLRDHHVVACLLGVPKEGIRDLSTHYVTLGVRAISETVAVLSHTSCLGTALLQGFASNISGWTLEHHAMPHDQAA